MNIPQGYNFNTARERVRELRFKLHLTRRELGRLRRLPPTKRIDKMIDQLEQRECLLEETLCKD